jgi:hypothetical protein
MPGFIHTLLCTGVAVSAVTGPVAAPGSTLIALQHIEIGQY